MNFDKTHNTNTRKNNMIVNDARITMLVAPAPLIEVFRVMHVAKNGWLTAQTNNNGAANCKCNSLPGAIQPINNSRPNTNKKPIAVISITEYFQHNLTARTAISREPAPKY